MVEYASLDMKRKILHKSLAAAHGVLSALLRFSPAGLFRQSDMTCALVTAANLSQQDAELEAYRLRVMLSHLGVVRARGVPSHIEGEPRARLAQLLEQLEVAKGQQIDKPQTCVSEPCGVT